MDTESLNQSRNVQSAPASESGPTSETVPAIKLALDDEAEKLLQEPDGKAAADFLRETVGVITTGGKVSVDMLSTISRGLSHARDLAKARAEGEIEGRNRRIDELMKERPADDGIPRLAGAHIPYTEFPSSIFDVARDAY